MIKADVRQLMTSYSRLIETFDLSRLIMVYGDIDDWNFQPQGRFGRRRDLVSSVCSLC